MERAREHRARTAIEAPEGAFGYAELLEKSAAAAAQLLGARHDLGSARVGLLAPAGWSYVVAQWAIWRAGGVAVPMAVSHPTAELAYLLDDARPEAVVAHPELEGRIRSAAEERGVSLVSTESLVGLDGDEDVRLPTPEPSRPCLMLYTSGTTGRPKGALITHANVEAQVRSLSEAWGWSSADRVLLHLPLHHVHGVVNVLACALWNGAVCEILPRFEPSRVWSRLASGELTLYMAVPTVYRRLIEAWEAADASVRSAWSAGARRCRLMVSGSAALPLSTLERWEEITGHRLLERYGMTEIGMALSNPLEGERRPGYVGRPLPGVEARLVDEAGRHVPEGAPGEIQVRGPTVFAGYWGRPDETAAAFTQDGWFRTGDLGVVERGAWRILGRASTDILKTGGEKVSALEIEDALRMHEAVVDCAVVGVPDADWGERVCAAVVVRPSSGLSPEELRAFARERLAPYKVPKEILCVGELPRNAMGKVTKPAVRALFATRSPDGIAGSASRR